VVCLGVINQQAGRKYDIAIVPVLSSLRSSTGLGTLLERIRGEYWPRFVAGRESPIDIRRRAVNSWVWVSLKSDGPVPVLRMLCADYTSSADPQPRGCDDTGGNAVHALR
jgi:hypothetical protein